MSSDNFLGFFLPENYILKQSWCLSLCFLSRSVHEWYCKIFLHHETWCVRFLFFYSISKNVF